MSIALDGTNGVTFNNGTTQSVAYISASSNTASSGYVTLGNGAILQWGKVTGTTSGMTITYPIAFPNSVTCITAEYANTATSGGSSWAVNSYTNSNFAFVTGNTGQTTFWFAAGY